MDLLINALSVALIRRDEQDVSMWYSVAMSIIEIHNLSKRFGKTQALDQVNLSIEEHSIHGFLGPNGAGKTTLLRILLGIIKPTSGNATIFGQDVFKDRIEVHKNIAYVPGEVNLWPNLTGGEVIDLLLGNGRINRREINHYLEVFELDPSKKGKTYSKGNRQKVALVAAFASPAELFILDEPTSGLDPLMEQRFQQVIKQKQQEGKTTFLSSHILSEVEQLATTVSIIREGEIHHTLTDLTNLNQYFQEKA